MGRAEESRDAGREDLTVDGKSRSSIGHGSAQSYIGATVHCGSCSARISIYLSRTPRGEGAGGRVVADPGRAVNVATKRYSQGTGPGFLASESMRDKVCRRRTGDAPFLRIGRGAPLRD